MTMQNQIEQIVETNARFNMSRLSGVLWPYVETLPALSTAIPTLRTRLGTHYVNLSHSIIRNTFLIELVKVPKIETTKFRVRWCEQLENDPRYCSFEECQEIAIDLLTSLIS